VANKNLLLNYNSSFWKVENLLYKIKKYYAYQYISQIIYILFILKWHKIDFKLELIYIIRYII
jgi:hypothetical protein